MITIENLDTLLQEAQLHVHPSTLEPFAFDRTRKFSVAGQDIVIEWWSNVGYVHIGVLTVPFDSIHVNRCWPNRDKSEMDLRFEYKGVDIGILALVDWKK